MSVECNAELLSHTFGKKTIEKYGFGKFIAKKFDFDSKSYQNIGLARSGVLMVRENIADQNKK